MEQPNGDPAVANATEDQTPDDVNEEQTATLDEVIKRDTHLRVLGESRKNKERAQIAEKRLADIEQQSLTEQGKYKELWENERGKRETLEKNFVRTRVASAINQAAANAGAIDVDAVTQLGKSDLLQYDEATEEVHGIEAFIEDVKASKPYLFDNKPKATINPVVPSSSRYAQPDVSGKPKTASELRAEIKELNKRR